MRKLSKGPALATLATLLVVSPQAFAYLDPGTGSLILQGLIAAIAGIAVAARVYWDRVVAWLREARAGSGHASDPAAEARSSEEIDGGD